MPWMDGDRLNSTNLNAKIPSGLGYSVTDAAYGATGNGTTADTTAIQAAFTAAPDGSTIVFPRGTYRTGIINITKSHRIVCDGASFIGIDSAIFAVTTAIDWLYIFGAEVESFEGASGEVGKEFLVNASTVASATISNYGQNLTAFADFATINEIGALLVERCRLGYAKVTIASSDNSTHVRVFGNRWEHGSTVNTAPAYLQLVDVRHPIVRDNEWIVYPPAGDNEDIVKVWGESADVIFTGNRIENRNTSCTMPQVDIYFGGARAQILDNHFINVHMHAKAWGLSDLGFEYRALRIAGNVFVRESGFSMVNEPEGTAFQQFMFVLATRFTVQGNQFVDLNSAGDPISAIYLGRATGSPPPDIDSLLTRHCRAFAIVGNTASFTAGNNQGVFIQYRNNNAADLEVNASVVGNVVHGGRSFWEASEQLASMVVLEGNVWLGQHSSINQLGLVAPCMLSGNLFPSTVALPAAVGVVVDTRTAKVTVDGTDGAVAAGSVGIAEEGGDLQLSSRQNVNVLIDNDNSGNNAFFVYSNATTDTGTPLLEVNENGETTMTMQRSLVTVGTTLTPSYAFASEKSLGWYRSSASAMALSYGTLDLTAANLSLKTTGTSISSANLGVNGIALFVGGTSGATLAVRSGGTIYFFSSSVSTVG